MCTQRQFLVGVSLVSALAVPSAHGQCQEWVEGFGFAGPQGEVRALVVFDGGSGPALYAAGSFTAAGNSLAKRVARWDGSSWSPLGAGPSNSIYELAAFDDGTGPALYAGGIQTLQRWDGAQWNSVGSLDGTVTALAVFDDGSGPALYVGGNFLSIGGVPAAYIARWDGVSFTTVGGGVDDFVATLIVHDDGSGPALYAGGGFLQAGGAPAMRIARWDGVVWSEVGSGLPSLVYDLAVFDEGAGPKLFVAGSFEHADGVLVNNVARWDGTSWSSLSGGLNNFAYRLGVANDGSGTALFVGGQFTQAALEAGGVAANHIARWDGNTWSALGPGLGEHVRAIAGFDAGSGSQLYVGGSFSEADSNLVRWTGSGWAHLAGGPGGTNAPVRVLALHHEGGGQGGEPTLAVAGTFSAAGNSPASKVALWDGAQWSSLASSPPSDVRALASCDLGQGPTLFAGTNVDGSNGVTAARWDGANWIALGTPPDGTVVALLGFDDGSGMRLYAGGTFELAGGNPARFVASWDGSTWASVGTGVDHPVVAFAVFDDGSGPKLYAGGPVGEDGDLGRVARWDGASWTNLPDFNSAVYSLCVFDDGSGAALYAAGQFTTAGGQPAALIARWSGSSWLPLGSGLGGGYGAVHALAVFDDGDRPALYAGGNFSIAGGISVKQIARWNGSGWSALGSDLHFFSGQMSVSALAAFDGGSSAGPRLYVGGDFDIGGAHTSRNFAAWQSCGVGTLVCLGDGTGGACPCGNYGLPGHGCRNSATIRGAELEASGFASVAFDSLALACAFEPPNVTSVFFQGDQLVAPLAFGDGLRCAGGQLKRLYVLSADALGNVSAPVSGAPSITERSHALGDPIQAGSLRVYQVYYRDPDLGFCPPPLGDSFNISNGVKMLWMP